MEKNIGLLLKNIRKENNLTQKKFGDKFYLTEKTISNYENGKRTPGIDFLEDVCKKFKLPIDYFVSDKEESKSVNLISVSKYNKCALFDSAQSIYLTRFKYDTITISPFGNHIGINWGKEHSIEESEIIDNNGKIKKFKNLLFGHRGSFSHANTIIALNTKTNKLYIMDCNGTLLSDGYNIILPLGHLNYDGSSTTALYVAQNKNESVVLLDLLGQKINVTIDSKFNYDNFELKIGEQHSPLSIYNYVREYGSIMVRFIDEDLFKDIFLYLTITEALCFYIANQIQNFETFNIENEVRSCICYMKEHIKQPFENCYRDDFKEQLNKRISFLNKCVKNKIQQNRIAKMFNDFEKFLFTLPFNSSSFKESSSPSDLIVVNKDNKVALFDKKQSVCITPYIYDKIVISPFGDHIGIKFDSNNNLKESVLIDNDGKVSKFDGDLHGDLLFGDVCSFSIEHTTVARNEFTHKYYIIDNKGNTISDGYDLISAYSIKEVTSTPPALFYVKVDENTVAVMDLHANIITTAQEKFWIGGCDYRIYVDELDNIENLVKYIKKYQVSTM